MAARNIRSGFPTGTLKYSKRCIGNAAGKQANFTMWHFLKNKQITLLWTYATITCYNPPRCPTQNNIYKNYIIFSYKCHS